MEKLITITIEDNGVKLKCYGMNKVEIIGALSLAMLSVRSTVKSDITKDEPASPSEIVTDLKRRFPAPPLLAPQPDMFIVITDFTKRTYNLLRKNKCVTRGDIYKLARQTKFSRGFGDGTVKEIKRFASMHGML